jgi:tetratricopeptide (TPR) repeat protein
MRFDLLYNFIRAGKGRFGLAGLCKLTKPAKICSLVLLSLIAASWSPLFSQDSQTDQSADADAVPLQVIVVRTPEEAQAVLDRLNKGEDFGALAKELSIDPTADAGGFIGNVSPSSLRAELRDALSGVAPGQVTGIVQIPSGYAILKIMANGGSGKNFGTSSMGETAPDPGRSFDLAAGGAVKYTLQIDGDSEALAVLNHFPKPAGWNADPHTVCAMRKQSMEDMIARFNRLVAPENLAALESHGTMEVMEAHIGLGQLYAYQGDLVPAIAQYQLAYQIALSDVPAATSQMEESLGILYLHKSDADNNVPGAPGERCLFPMRPGNAYKNTEDSQKAVEYFLKYLENKPDELEVKWLLNLAYMTMGKYPAEVPRKYVIPLSTFESKENVGRFIDVAPAAGLDSFSEAGGVIVDDFENNGRFDVVTSSFESCNSLRYFHNNGDGTFTDQTDKSGLSGIVGGLNIMQTDYNNDGCLDILVLRGAWEFPQAITLLRGNCDGTFTDVTKESGLGGVLTTSQAGVWADINNDGWLDLFIANENGPANLFLNKGDGTFQDIAASAGVAGDGTAYAKGVVAADYDNDGFVDFFVSNMTGSSFLYHNNHDNTFTDVAAKAGVQGNGKGFATWFFDYDNDGFPDIFVSSFIISVDETMRTYLGLPHNATTLRLYKNLGDGTFRDVTKEVGLDKVFMPMGANFGDVDNDGYLDIYLGTGSPSYGSLVPNVLLRNDEGKHFTDITASSGTGELHKGHGIAFADLTNTGNQDIVAEIGGATPGDRHALRLFENPGHDNDWIALNLVGVKTNRAAIGARIKVTVENKGQGVRSIYSTVGSGGSFGASPLEQHIGLGKSATIRSIEIFWPGSGTRQVFSNVGKNQFLQITELADTFTKLDRKPVRLGGPRNNAATASKSAPENPTSTK